VSAVRFTITIEAPDCEDDEEVELPRAPSEDDAVETNYGDLHRDSSKIFRHLP
jgi:hypothetical protein